MTKPHSIIFCDIDGCLNDGKHIGFDLDALAVIRTQIKTLEQRGVLFSLCTGRPQPYAEAMAQVLNVQTPFICEHGAMVFDPRTDQAMSLLAAGDRNVIADLRHHLAGIVGVDNTHAFEPGNEYALCITGPQIANASYSEIQLMTAAYQEQCSQFDVTWTSSNCAIDITPKGISKQTGAAHLLERFSIDQSAAFAIGDSVGDIAVLSFVGHAMCPANAAAEVKQICRTVVESPTTGGVVEILDMILKTQNA